HEPRAVARDVEVGSVGAGIEADVEQRLGTACRELSPGDDRGNHHLVVVTEEQLAAIVRPHRIDASFGRHEPFGTRTWKRLHVDVVATGLVRYVSDPLAVGREPRRSLV